MIYHQSLPFTKLVGTGNDFLFLDFRDEHPKLSVTRNQLAARIGHRNTGVGSDGIIFVERVHPDSEKLRWDFYNPDGSSAEMCGNAVRCMGRWAHEVAGLDTLTFGTVIGDVTVSKTDGEFAAILKLPDLSPQKLMPLEFGDQVKVVPLINTGVPHAVINVARVDGDKDAQLEMVRAYRHHKDAGARGTNVTFLERVSEKQFRTVTFERGVEGYTLSCGTGVMAAAAVGLGITDAASVPQDRSAELETPGGRLKVVFKERLSAVHLIGPAEVICTGQIEERYLR